MSHSYVKAEELHAAMLQAYAYEQGKRPGSLPPASWARAWDSAMRSRGAAARCYAAIARSLRKGKGDGL